MSHASTSPRAAGQRAPSNFRRAARLATLAAVWHAVADGPSSLVAWVVERRRVSRSIATLESLSDHILKDIGIERSDIPRITRNGRG